MEFEHWWQHYFGVNLPLGHVLRDSCPRRWFRVHSLPQSKRWPTEPAEYDELLRRHNAIATEVLGVGSNCWLAAVTYVETHIGAQHAATPALPNIDHETWSKPIYISDPAEPHIEDGDSLTVLCWATQVRWDSGQFDAIIRLVADDEAPQLLFAEMERARIYAPYDGGADLFLDSQENRDKLRAVYSEWTSPLRSGL